MVCIKNFKSRPNTLLIPSVRTLLMNGSFLPDYRAVRGWREQVTPTPPWSCSPLPLALTWECPQLLTRDMTGVLHLSPHCPQLSLQPRLTIVCCSEMRHQPRSISSMRILKNTNRIEATKKDKLFTPTLHRVSFINGVKLICSYVSQSRTCQLLQGLTGTCRC